MPHLSSNIPSSIFHDLIFLEFLRIASELFLKMVAQVGNRNKIRQQIKKLFQRNPEILNKYQSSYTKIIELIKTK